MSNYSGEASKFSSKAEIMEIKLRHIKQRFQSSMDNLGVSKVNGNLQYTVAEGDYLTDNVAENLDTSISDLDALISDIEGRASAVAAEADRLDKLAEQEAAKNKEPTDGTSDGGTPSDGGGTSD